MKKPIPVELLEKYLNGECSAEEAASVRLWYAFFNNEPGHVETLSREEQEILEEKIYNCILSDIGTVEEAEVVQMPRLNPHGWYKIAGATAVFLALVTAAVFYTRKPGSTHQTATGAQVVAITNNSAHIYKAVLPDNSVVWVSPKATLRYPKTFEARARMVSMSGECFFEVTKNPQRPFIITSTTIITKVWGTSFLVRDNGAGRTADVSVVTGKVSVSIKDKSSKNLLTVNKGEVMLYPQQKATYVANLHQLKPESAANDTRLKIWKHVSLYFDNKPLTEIVAVLNTTFNTNIKLTDDKIARYQLTADLSGLNLPDVLEVLNKALNIDYTIKDNVIELSKPIK
jgi:transmembrane sensor